MKRLARDRVCHEEKLLLLTIGMLQALPEHRPADALVDARQALVRRVVAATPMDVRAARNRPRREQADHRRAVAVVRRRATRGEIPRATGADVAADCGPALAMGDSVLVEARSAAERLMLVMKGRASCLDQPSIRGNSRCSTMSPL